jgi:hypothetical protein
MNSKIARVHALKSQIILECPAERVLINAQIAAGYALAAPLRGHFFDQRL